MAPNGTWDGKERRRSSTAERAAFASLTPEQRAEVLAAREEEERQLDVLAKSPAKGALRILVRSVPRPMLVVLALAGVATAIRSEGAWRQGVDTHIRAADSAYTRLSAVEGLAAATSAEVKDTRGEVRLLREEQMRSRSDQLEFYAAWATAQGLDQLAAQFRARRKAMLETQQ